MTKGTKILNIIKIPRNGVTDETPKVYRTCVEPAPHFL